MDAVSDEETARALEEILPPIKRGLADLFERLTEREHGRLALSAKEIQDAVRSTEELQAIPPGMLQKLSARIAREHLLRQGREGFVEACLQELMISIHAMAMGAGTIPALERLRSMKREGSAGPAEGGTG